MKHWTLSNADFSFLETSSCLDSTHGFWRCPFSSVGLSSATFSSKPTSPLSLALPLDTLIQRRSLHHHLPVSSIQNFTFRLTDIKSVSTKFSYSWISLKLRRLETWINYLPGKAMTSPYPIWTLLCSSAFKHETINSLSVITSTINLIICSILTIPPLVISHF